jgi:hypothetical protein
MTCKRAYLNASRVVTWAHVRFVQIIPYVQVCMKSMHLHAFVPCFVKDSRYDRQSWIQLAVPAYICYCMCVHRHRWSGCKFEYKTQRWHLTASALSITAYPVTVCDRDALHISFLQDCRLACMNATVLAASMNIWRHARMHKEATKITQWHIE